MGSGKSTIAKKLSETIHLNAFDLDEIIEKSQKKSITELFSEGGEVSFRKLEHHTLVELINDSKPFVLSLGGGKTVSKEWSNKIQHNLLPPCIVRSESLLRNSRTHTCSR